MTADSDIIEAVRALQAVGLTEYEARCFVGLSQVPSGTASDVSELGDLPRSRVYDLAESLQERGLVEIQDGTPRRFRAVSTDVAIERLREDYADSLASAANALRTVTAPGTEEPDGGIWTIEGRQNVVRRGQCIAARAERELFGLFTDAAVFEDECFRQAQDALDRGVRVFLGSPDEGLCTEFREHFPEAVVWEPTLDWQTLPALGTQLSRLVMADRNIVMLATLGRDGNSYDESATWGEGPDSPLVILARQVIGSRLDDLESSEDASGLPL